ncbi:hypothetical protein F0223_06105 [Vibrio coralliilyticus]|uniref:hypothetical protein n=1 Tax=Vibrio TaxID=662 RepID=UPI000501102E|nr:MULTISPECIES: hypothetical protein [Vibrio]ANW26704.1 hypothetical protein BA953_21395 [Vibrio coralliilyticus]KFI12990.1 hypothetical protein IX95_03320 [Vibrio sp. B183]NOI17803.1 hypothetical protein [Vibrio coralliilyticus]
MKSLVVVTLISNSIVSENFDGYYSLECGAFHEPFGEVSIKNEEAVIEVASNQVYIKARVLNHDDSYHLYYSSSDIGLGGFDIPFDTIDATYPIAKISQTENGIAFNWFGLIDSDGNRINLPVSSLPIDKGILRLKKCDE